MDSGEEKKKKKKKGLLTFAVWKSYKICSPEATQIGMLLFTVHKS